MLLDSVPKGFDYDLWLGPAPEAPFCHDRCLVSGQRNGIFHIYDYAIGFIAGWAAHPLDQVQWWADHSDRGIPGEVRGDRPHPQGRPVQLRHPLDVRCTYADGLVVHFVDNETYVRYTGAPHPQMERQGFDGVHNAAIFVGTEGWVAIAHASVKTQPASLLTSEIGPNEIHLPRSDSHQAGWIECVKARKDPISPIETAVRSDLVSHLSDIAVRTGRAIRWDPVNRTIVGDEAARKMMSRPMRKPWSLA